MRKSKALSYMEIIGYVFLLSLFIVIGTAEINKIKNDKIATLANLDAPPVGVDSSPTPLGKPQPVTYSTSYKFTNLNVKTKAPISWDPCRPIHYVINNQNQLPNGMEMIQAAVNEISYYSGFKFVYDGPSRENFQENRKSYQPKIYGNKWSPVLFTWSTPVTHPGLSQDVLGEGGASVLNRSSDSQIYVSGIVDLESGALKEFMSTKKDDSKVKAVILHELGHVMGLDHTDGPWEIMYPEANLQVFKLGLGDISGLSILGSQPCHPEL